MVIFLMVALLFTGCGRSGNLPDVSGLEAPIEWKRFDADFFAIDTNQIGSALAKLQQEYPRFLNQYLEYVLGLQVGHPQTETAIRAFLKSYTPVYKTADEVVKNHQRLWQDQLEESLKYWQYYFPNRKLETPFQMVTFIGPMDALEPFAIGDYGDVRTQGGAGVAMQFHLGKEAPVYEEGMQSGLLNDYQVRRFTPDMAPVNTMKNIIEDAFPYKAANQSMVEQMVEKGKRLYLLDKLMPEAPDSLTLGYTAKQVEGCFANEGLIWNYFVKNDLVYNKDPMMMQLYLRDGPKTQELGEGAPGYIGLFVGRQIVQSFMDKNPELGLEKLMAMPALQVFENAGYKPK